MYVSNHFSCNDSVRLKSKKHNYNGHFRSIDSRPSSVCSRSSQYSLSNRHHSYKRHSNSQHHHHHHRSRSAYHHHSRKSHDNVDNHQVSVGHQHSPQRNQHHNYHPHSLIHKSKSDTNIYKRKASPKLSESLSPYQGRSFTPPLQRQVTATSGDLSISPSNSLRGVKKTKGKSVGKKNTSLEVPTSDSVTRGLSPKSVNSDQSVATMSSGVFMDTSSPEEVDTLTRRHEPHHQRDRTSKTANTAAVSQHTHDKVKSMSRQQVRKHSDEERRKNKTSAKHQQQQQSDRTPKYQSVDSAYQSTERNLSNSSTVSPTNPNPGHHWWKHVDIDIRSLPSVLGKR